LNVHDNAAFGLKMRRLLHDEISRRVATVLDLVNLTGFEQRQVTDLSGGEQQRVALARALATHPRLLMFDEPLGALDRTLREDLLDELRTILRHTGIPAIYVTHDQEEAFAIADRILILHDGKIICTGTPAEVWSNPGSAFAARFLGVGNVIQGEVRGKREEGSWDVKTAAGLFTVRCGHGHQVRESVHVLVRPRIAEGESNVIRGIVSDVIYQEDRFKVTFENSLFVYLQKSPGAGDEIEVPVKVECLA